MGGSPPPILVEVTHLTLTCGSLASEETNMKWFYRHLHIVTCYAIYDIN